MISVLCAQGGVITRCDHVEEAWLHEGSGATFWIDLSAPSPEETAILRTSFKFHELSIEDAMSASHHPKVEAYSGYLYVILHGIDFLAERRYFATHDTDFFIGPNYLVTVHDGKTRSIPETQRICGMAPHILAEGPLALMHRIVDTMVDHYNPEVDKFRSELDTLEELVFEHPDPQLVRTILRLKHDVASLRRVILPQRDVVARLARREFAVVTEPVAFRFRDVYDHLVRLGDDAVALQDRVSGLLEANLSSTSNQLNRVMKVLTLIATVFMPLTVLTSMWGMNVELPMLPGGAAAQFWWVVGLMAFLTLGMAWFFKRQKWL